MAARTQEIKSCRCERKEAQEVLMSGSRENSCVTGNINGSLEEMKILSSQSIAALKSSWYASVVALLAPNSLRAGEEDCGVVLGDDSTSLLRSTEEPPRDLARELMRRSLDSDCTLDSNTCSSSF